MLSIKANHVASRIMFLELAMNLPCEVRRAEHDFIRDGVLPHAMHRNGEEAAKEGSRPKLQ